jgi:hypothetical protein
LTGLPPGLSIVPAPAGIDQVKGVQGEVVLNDKVGLVEAQIDPWHPTMVIFGPVPESIRIVSHLKSEQLTHRS